MKKDDRLEREFDAYFDGVTPPDNATDSAKKLIEKKARTKRTGIRFIPAFATVAAACGIAVLAVNLGGRDSATPSTPTNPDTPPTDFSPAPDNSFSYYTADALTTSALDVYSTDLPKGLDFVKKLELAKNAAVYDFCAYTDADGAVSLVRADVSAVVNGFRHDTTVYVEYTPERTVYEPLKTFYDGDELTAKDDTIISYTENNGEKVCNLLTYENGVRYYISVESADSTAYRYYLSLI